MRGSVTPTRRYWASMRLAGSSMKSSLISPTDVESPMCTTDVHDVVVGVDRATPAPRSTAPVAVDATPAPAASAAGVVTSGSASTEATDAESEPSIQAPTTVRTTTTTAGMARARGNDMRAGTLPVAARQVLEGRRCPTRGDRSATGTRFAVGPTGATRPSEGAAGHDHHRRRADRTARRRRPRRTSPARSPRVVDVLRRYWATTLIVLVVIVAGVSRAPCGRPSPRAAGCTTTSPTACRRCRTGGGGRSSPACSSPRSSSLYIPILLLLVVAASIYERRVGHVRTLVVAIGGQFLGALLTAAVPVAVRRQRLDVGPRARARARPRDLGRRLRPRRRAHRRDAAGVAHPGPVGVRRLPLRHGAQLGPAVGRRALHRLRPRPRRRTVPRRAGCRPPQVRFDRRTQRALVALIIAAARDHADLIEGVFPGNGGPFHTRHAADQLDRRDAVARHRRAAAAGRRRRPAPRPAGGLDRSSPSSSRSRSSACSAADAERRAHRRPDPHRRAARCCCSSRTGPSPPARTARSFRTAGRRLLWVAVGLFVYTAVGFAVLQDDFVPNGHARPT